MLPEEPTVIQSPIQRILATLQNRYRALRAGEVATYIPELAKADPSTFGIAIATVEGGIYSAGDDDKLFTIQSISKPFTYGLALEKHGLDAVMSNVGVEPSGDAFNSIELDRISNRPFNPMVNSGAIATTSLVPGKTPAERWQATREFFAGFAGRSLTVDEKVYLSEKKTGHRNRSIAYLMLNCGMIGDRVEDILDLYFRQCSLLVTVRDLAVMAATLANCGQNPVTGQSVLARQHVSHILSVMASCGMYDYSGEWMYQIGMPAKSGVSGGLLVVLPGQLGIGIFSPPLDRRGNSVRGIKVCQDLSKELGLHLFAAAPPLHAVRRLYRGNRICSRHTRPEHETQHLWSLGQRILIAELQGVLDVLAIERLVCALEQQAEDYTYLILDGRRVGTIRQEALVLLQEFKVSLQGQQQEIILSAFPERIDFIDLRFTSSDLALEWCENALLDDRLGKNRSETIVDLTTFPLFSQLQAEDLEILLAAASYQQFLPEETIAPAGEIANALFFLAHGIVSIRTPGNCARYARLSAGTFCGEMAFLDARARSADIVADTNVKCYTFTRAAIEELAIRRPHVYGKLMQLLAQILSKRLQKADCEVAVLF